VIDLVVVLRATRHKISDTFSQANLLAVHGKKLNLTQQKHAFTNQKMHYHTKYTLKLEPGLVICFYNIRPGNGAGLCILKGKRK